jgi:hypothetical protein
MKKEYCWLKEKSMFKYGQLFLLLSISCILSGCATTTADLVGGSAGLACAGNINTPDGLMPGKRQQLAIKSSVGGGRYSGIVSRLNYDVVVVEKNVLGFSVGYFQDDAIASGKGMVLGSKYRIGLAKTSNGFQWLSMTPEYNFMVTNYSDSYAQFQHSGEVLNLYNSYVHIIGCDFALGFKADIIGADVHLGPFFGSYSFHSSRDEHFGFSAWKGALRVFLELGYVILDASFSVLAGDSDAGGFLDEFVGFGLGYQF